MRVGGSGGGVTMIHIPKKKLHSKKPALLDLKIKNRLSSVVHLDVPIFFSIFLCLTQIVGKQFLIRIAFDLSDKVHDNNEFYLSSVITRTFFIEICTAYFKN